MPSPEQVIDFGGPVGDSLFRRFAACCVPANWQSTVQGEIDEVFLWFRNASIAQISRVELPSAHHLCWPELDVDLAVESITHPERYPLLSQVLPKRRLRPAKAQTRRRSSSSAKRRPR
jgi:hypothetical protein